MGNKGKTKLIAALIVLGFSCIFTGCVVAPDPYYGSGVEMAPPLPVFVEMYGRPNYYHRGYHYLYDNNQWYYTRNTRDHWRQLPRTHWPRDTQYHRDNSHREDRYRHRDRDQYRDDHHRDSQRYRDGDHQEYRR